MTELPSGGADYDFEYLARLSHIIARRPVVTVPPETPCAVCGAPLPHPTSLCLVRVGEERTHLQSELAALRRELEAKDAEIAALRAEVSGLQAERDAAIKQAANLRAENERLRAALESVIEMPPVGDEEWSDANVTTIQNIARRALEGSKEGA